MKQRLVWWVLTIGCAALILTLSCQSVSTSSQLSGTITNIVLEQDSAYQELPPSQQTIKNDEFHDQLRKNAHVAVFAALAFCAAMLVRTYTVKWWLPIATPACMVFAVLDECVQHLRNAGRSFELSDIYRDWIGVSIGIVVALAAVLIVLMYQRMKREATNNGVSGTGAG